MIQNSLTIQKLIIMKKSILGLACFFLIAASSFASTPNEKVLKIFEATFGSPKNVVWYEHKDHYDVSFMQAGIRSTVKYDLVGNFVSSIRYYGEQNLPLNIVCQIKKKFADKRIFGVTETTTEDDVCYYVKLEGPKTWTTLKVSSNGYMVVVEKFRKA